MSCKWDNAKCDLFEHQCPFMLHTLYPYFLGAFYGAKYGYNEKGDCQVCCPAEKSVDVLVKVRPNDGSFPEEVPANWRDVIHAEVVKVNGDCPHGYTVGTRILFPTYAKGDHICPSLVHTIFPVILILEEWILPKCINSDKLRCTDWMEEVYYSW